MIRFGLRRRTRISGIPALIVLIIVLMGIGGWIANIVKFFGMLDGGFTAMFVARIVGIFAAPLGAILGYL